MKSGYSRINPGGGRVYAHRHAWEQEHGAIPPGMHVHHRCGNRRCSNIDHLELVGSSQHPKLHPRPRPDRCQKCGGEDWYARGRDRECRICRRRQRRERYHTDPEYRAKHNRAKLAVARRERAVV